MRYQFVHNDDGLVDVALDDDLPLIQHALEDSLGTRPPLGAPQDGPSTYWLDHAITGLRERMASGGSVPLPRETSPIFNSEVTGSRPDWMSIRSTATSSTASRRQTS